MSTFLDLGLLLANYPTHCRRNSWTLHSCNNSASHVYIVAGKRLGGIVAMVYSTISKW